jgi:hypothetical protein
VTRAVITSVAIAVVLIAAYYTIPLDGASTRTSALVRTAGGLAAMIAAIALSARSIRRARFPLLRAAQAVTGVVVLSVVLFAAGYCLMSAGDAGAFSEPLDHTDALYFSLTTATTVGFGDINARSEPARIVVMLHMVANVVLIGVSVRMLLRIARQQRQA